MSTREQTKQKFEIINNKQKEMVIRILNICIKRLDYVLKKQTFLVPKKVRIVHFQDHRRGIYGHFFF